MGPMSPLFVLLLLLWDTISTAAATPSSFTLSDQILGQVPECARGCFKDSINADFSVSDCTTNPSLQCLCSLTDSGGFTLGEIAVQCMFAEITVGACVGNDASEGALNNALFMCSSEPSAAPRTHTAINATIIIQGTGTGSVIVVTPSATTTSMTGSSSYETMSTVLVTPAPSQSASVSRSTTALPQSTPASLVTEAAAATAISTPTQAKGSPLGSGMVAGIILGGVAAIGIAAWASCFCWSARKRRKLHKSEGGLLTPSSPERETPNSYIGFGPPMTLSSSSPPNNIPQPTMFPRASMHSGNIGLALSPGPGSEASQVQHARSAKKDPPPHRIQGLPRNPATKLLPPVPLQPNKPVLTLAIPRADGSGSEKALAPPLRRATGQSSIITPFEEDGEDPSSATQIWRPPLSAGPQSATTYYVADKNGNWVLGDPKSPPRPISQIAELEAPGSNMAMSPTEEAEQAIKLAEALAVPASVGSRSRPGPKGKGKELQQPYLVVPKPPPNPGGSRSSSIYSQASFTPGTRRGSWSRLSRKAKPTARASGATTQERSDPRISNDSATTFDSIEDSFDFDDENVLDLVQPLAKQPKQKRKSQLIPEALSPVVESPASGGGKSSNTKIPQSSGPGRLKYPATVRLVPPPRQPDFKGSTGQLGPTLGEILSEFPSAPGPSSSRQPAVPGPAYAPHLRSIPGTQTSQSPPLNGVTGQTQTSKTPALTSQMAKAQQLQQARGQRNQAPMNAPNALPPLDTSVAGLYKRPPQVQGRAGLPSQTLQQQYYRPQQGNDNNSPRAKGMIAGMGMGVGLPHIATQGLGMAGIPPQIGVTSPTSAGTPTTIASTTSSLLAKRVGNDRAQQLSLSRMESGRREKWTRQQRAENSSARRPSGPNGMLSPDNARNSDPRMPLPATPTWQPKLTPTRRGEDLVLNVQ